MRVVAACAFFGAPDWLTVCLFGTLILSLGSLVSIGSRLLMAPLWVYRGEVSFAVNMASIPCGWSSNIAPGSWLGLSGETLPPLLWAIFFVGVVPRRWRSITLVEGPVREAIRGHGVPFLRRRAALAGRPPEVALARL